jgi:hypothetical protein
MLRPVHIYNEGRFSKVYVLRNNNFIKRSLGLACLLFFILIHPVFSSPGEEVITNFGLLEDLSRKVTGELLSNMPQLPDGTLIFLKKDKGVGPADFILENVMLLVFQEAGVRVTLENPRDLEQEEPRAVYQLSYQIIKMSLKYPRISRRYWLGAKQVEREAELGVFAQLVEMKSGDIVWVGDTQKNHEDIIGYSLLEQVEDPEYAFTRPERKEIRLGRLIEPMIVGGVVIGLVYLFFSNQSND